MTYDNFVAEEHKPDNNLLPVDTYKMAITKTEVSSTSTGGKKLSLQATIQEGQYQGRIVFINLNLQTPPNPTPGQITGKNIAGGMLGDILRACGIAAIPEPIQAGHADALLAIPFMGSVIIKDERNEVKRVRTISGQSAQAATEAPQWPGAK